MFTQKNRHTRAWLWAAAIYSAAVTHAVRMAADCGTGFRPPPCPRCRLAHAMEDLRHGSDVTCEAERSRLTDRSDAAVRDFAVSCRRPSDIDPLRSYGPVPDVAHFALARKLVIARLQDDPIGRAAEVPSVIPLAAIPPADHHRAVGACVFMGAVRVLPVQLSWAPSTLRQVESM